MINLNMNNNKIRKNSIFYNTKNKTSNLGIVLSKLYRGSQMYKKEIFIPFNKFNYSVLLLLLKKGFILNFHTVKISNDSIQSQRFFVVSLKYSNGKPVINGFKLYSKPTKRLFVTVQDIRKNFLQDFLVVSTTRGLLSSYECLSYNLGGELLLSIF